jgi:hypothetical protein
MTESGQKTALLTRGMDRFKYLTNSMCQYSFPLKSLCLHAHGFPACVTVVLPPQHALKNSIGARRTGDACGMDALHPLRSPNEARLARIDERRAVARIRRPVREADGVSSFPISVKAGASSIGTGAWDLQVRAPLPRTFFQRRTCESIRETAPNVQVPTPRANVTTVLLVCGTRIFGPGGTRLHGSCLVGAF